MNLIAARIRWTVQVCTVVRGQVASIASGNPVRPSQQTISTSRTPRLRSSAQTPAQNLAPSVGCTQIPSTCLTPSRSTPTAMWAALLRTCQMRVAVADPDHEGIHVDDRVDLVQRPVLPGLDL